jgi:hypothetical protein
MSSIPQQRMIHPKASRVSEPPAATRNLGANRLRTRALPAKALCQKLEQGPRRAVDFGRSSPTATSRPKTDEQFTRR